MKSIGSKATNLEVRGVAEDGEDECAVAEVREVDGCRVLAVDPIMSDRIGVIMIGNPQIVVTAVIVTVMTVVIVAMVIIVNETAMTVAVVDLEDVAVDVAVVREDVDVVMRGTVDGEGIVINRDRTRRRRIRRRPQRTRRGIEGVEVGHEHSTGRSSRRSMSMEVIMK